MKRMLIWETSADIAGGQRMTLTVMELLRDEYEFLCLIPTEGKLSQELVRRGIGYVCLGDQTLPAGVKGWQAYLQYAGMSLRSILRSMGAIRRFRPDVLYAPGPAALPWSALCGTLSGRPVVWHLHHLFADGPTKKLLNFTSGWKAVRRIISVSRVVGEQITSPAGQAKVQPLYNPVDAAHFSSGHADGILAETEAALGHAIPREDGCVLLQIAVLRPIKRQERFLRVVAALKRQGVPVTGILVGGAITEDDRLYEASLRQMIAAEGLTADVYMAGQRSNIPDYLAAASVVLIPSQSEGLPLAALEAMCAGKPIVATDAGGVAELLREAGCGVLYPPDAPPEKIAEIIRDTWQNDQQEGVHRGIGFCQAHGLTYYREEIRRIFAAVCNN